MYEQVLGEEKYTFVEECENAKSCTILIKGGSGWRGSKKTAADKDVVAVEK